MRQQYIIVDEIIFIYLYIVYCHIQHGIFMWCRVLYHILLAKRTNKKCVNAFILCVDATEFRYMKMTYGVCFITENINKNRCRHRGARISFRFRASHLSSFVVVLHRSAFLRPARTRITQTHIIDL